MCLAVYIASDLELPLVPWDESKPAFHIRELDYNKGVRKQFSLPNVRVAGSDAGCGCGFLKDGIAGQEFAEALENYSQFATYIEEQQNRGGTVEIFSCWEGDQTTKPESNQVIDVEELRLTNFEFKEKAFYSVK